MAETQRGPAGMNSMCTACWKVALWTGGQSTCGHCGSALDPPMFVRAKIDGSWYDIAIADISAIEVPMHEQQPAVHFIVDGLHAMTGTEGYRLLHTAWVVRRRSAAGR